MITPNMDRLVEKGTLFEKAFCPGATCVASRASIFTGMYPHNTGVYSFDRWSDQHNFVKELGGSGYHCVNLGKMHVIPIHDAAGFHERRVVENKSSQLSDFGIAEDEWVNFLLYNGMKRPNTRHIDYENWEDCRNAIQWEYDDNLHSDNYVGDISAQWIRSWNKKKPLFLEIGFAGPHEPYDPPKKYLDMYEGVTLPKPIYMAHELDEKPIQQKIFRDYFRYQNHGEAKINIEDATDEDILRMRKHYYANVTLIDEKIGHIIEALKDNEMLDNSIIVLTSDHGENLGDHKMPYKWFMYDTIVNVPLVVCDFREKHATVNTVSEDLVNLIDLAPTFLEYAGVAIPDCFEGKSLIPILRGEKDTEERDYVFCEDNYLMMIRSKTHKLVYYIDQAYGEFYDLVADPNELKNLFDEPSAQRLILAYKAKLLDWLAKSNYFNGPYKSSRSKHYSVRWPSDEHYGYFLQGSKAVDGCFIES